MADCPECAYRGGHSMTCPRGVEERNPNPAATDGGEWDPEPAKLRDDETRDDDMGHAARNAAQLAMADRTTKQTDENTETMTPNRTEWLEYGEPINNDRVEATKITTYETGPNEDLRLPEETYGTIPMELLDLIEGHEHQHDDGSLMLSALVDDEREKIDAGFESYASAIAEYSRECHDDYLEDYEDVHGEPVAEFPSLLVFADTHGYEYNEWAADLGIPRDEVSHWHHEQARGADYNWSTSDPVVLLRD